MFLRAYGVFVHKPVFNITRVLLDLIPVKKKSKKWKDVEN